MTNRPRFRLAAAALLMSLPAPASAQGPLDTLAFGALTWRSIGPQRGGRSVAVAGSAARPAEYYMGTTGGGVFKTSDGGENWLPVSDKYFGGTIGAIAVSESSGPCATAATGSGMSRAAAARRKRRRLVTGES